MTTPTNLAIEIGQRCLKDTPLIVLGSGASVAHGLPTMGDLATTLKNSYPDCITDDSYGERWGRFVEDLRKINLEDALTRAQLDDPLHDHVIRETWQCINRADRELFGRLVTGGCSLPLSDLYRYLFNSTNRTLTVVTTNYDRLAEYAADCANFDQFTGFTKGYLQRRSERFVNPRPRTGSSPRTVEIWKVHGSLDWFVGDGNREISIPLAQSIPNGLIPAIVTPGVAKYERTHQEPFRSTITEADRALVRAKAFLCVGFGFNDQHIQPKLMESWQQNDALLVVLAKELTDSAKSLLRKANGRQFLTLEEAPNLGTRLRSHHDFDGEVLEGVDLWRLDDFLSHTT